MKQKKIFKTLLCTAVSAVLTAVLLTGCGGGGGGTGTGPNNPSNPGSGPSSGKTDITEKDNTTGLKLNVLGQLMKIDQVAKMLGNFNNTNILLQTEKIAGNVRACMGFVKDKKSKMYVPNTALQKDIRDITDSTNKIIAILKKGIDEELYCNITYIKNDYLIERILKNNYIKEMIDVDKIYSNKMEINKKILEYKNETVEEKENKK